MSSFSKKLPPRNFNTHIFSGSFKHRIAPAEPHTTMATLQRLNMSDKINTWFYTRLSDNIAPADTVCMIAEDFAIAVDRVGLKIPYTFTKFRDIICDATCSMYHASLEHKTVVANFKSIVKPEGWTSDIEHIWMDYITAMFFDGEFWSDFWHHIDSTMWEYDFSSYRSFIQSILPMYVERKYDLMYEAGLLFQNKEGEIVTADEYDDAEDYGNDYDT